MEEKYPFVSKRRNKLIEQLTRAYDMLGNLDDLIFAPVEQEDRERYKEIRQRVRQEIADYKEELLSLDKDFG